MKKKTAEKYAQIALQRARELLRKPDARREELYPAMVGILSVMLERKDDEREEFLRTAREIDVVLCESFKAGDTASMNAIVKLGIAINKLEGE